MTLKELLEITDSNTVVQIVVEMFGTKFKAEHYTGWWLDEENEDLLKKEVEKIATINEVLKIYLK